MSHAEVHKVISVQVKKIRLLVEPADLPVERVTLNPSLLRQLADQPVGRATSKSLAL